jgi:hypothetical protein
LAKMDYYHREVDPQDVALVKMLVDTNLADNPDRLAEFATDHPRLPYCSMSIIEGSRSIDAIEDITSPDDEPYSIERSHAIVLGDHGPELSVTDSVYDEDGVLVSPPLPDLFGVPEDDRLAIIWQATKNLISQHPDIEETGIAEQSHQLLLGFIRGLAAGTYTLRPKDVE